MSLCSVNGKWDWMQTFQRIKFISSRNIYWLVYRCCKIMYAIKMPQIKLYAVNMKHIFVQKHSNMIYVIHLYLCIEKRTFVWLQKIIQLTCERWEKNVVTTDFQYLLFKMPIQYMIPCSWIQNHLWEDEWKY